MILSLQNELSSRTNDIEHMRGELPQMSVNSVPEVSSSAPTDVRAERTDKIALTVDQSYNGVPSHADTKSSALDLSSRTTGDTTLAAVLRPAMKPMSKASDLFRGLSSQSDVSTRECAQ